MSVRIGKEEKESHLLGWPTPVTWEHLLATLFHNWLFRVLR